ncbi:MAG: aminotransferase class I/II-fold pyridoxal phosphate-dependent enzyme [Planctomycetes bacterium]|nr:aminotransferase class I/II-fold pyridoxal phosphate-dependent enzyme [Planctomycetota bacterium]
MSDFRSDTVTKPTPEMLAAMAAADVGDDVLGDDPTVKKLEETAAALFGKGGGMFVPSGSMGNQVSIAAQTRPGDEIIIDENAHIFLYEAGALARVPAVQSRTLKSKNGALDPAEVEAAIRPDDVHDPRTSLVAVEQTHLMSGGRVVPLENLQQIRAIANRYKLRVHCDGARIFNASIASGVPVREYAKNFDSLTFCLSKGLSCPVGSIVVGDAAFLKEAHRVRKWMGGGMRQSGYLAACGIVALRSMIDRLADDHRNAGRLAELICEIPNITIDPKDVTTNIVFIETRAGRAKILEAALHAEGVWCFALGPSLLRLVTHRHIGAREIEHAAAAFVKISKLNLD